MNTWLIGAALTALGFGVARKRATEAIDTDGDAEEEARPRTTARRFVRELDHDDAAAAPLDDDAGGCACKGE